ncbi:alpha/beta fold hydrolase [Sphingopyxis sp. JAI128]|uniref:alpha/beta fold hydrolase n=1 Tax=Sphingopyxis sp. JAI128 TaxID=2723066 RepID=UPI0016108487|nr:alpha/beta hydrolase [Sphingopyxis sp. JAI128]MBB6426940.1 pimeloyl-ACP methyl ester carboxylesterase [Sphingopyxis sp. JAI128]
MVRRDILKMGAGLAAAATAGPALPARARLASAEFADQRRIATLSEGDIAYVEAGEGPRTAIFLHGWPLNGFHWRDSIAVLSQRRRCIAPDFMGLGYSEVRAEQDLSPQAQAGMILGLMDALGVASADIVANDSGTGVAQFLAASHPHRIDSLLLSNGDAHTNSPPEALRPALEAARNGSLADLIARHLAEPGFSVSALGLGHICYTDPANLTEEAMRTYFTPLLATPLRRAQFQQYGVAFEPNLLPAIEGRLKAYRGPVRMIWGTGDVHFRFEWAEWLDRTFPASRGIRKVDGAKLFFTEERPDIVIAEARFLWA